MSVDRVELLELDVDTRLADLWAKAEAIGMSPREREVFGPYIRAAYGQGWTDALTELPRGALALEHGFTVPRRQRVVPS